MTLIEIPPVNARQLAAKEVLQALGAKGLTRVFCEGGGMLAASLLSADLVDELILFHAGLAIGAEGMPGIGPLGIHNLNDASRMELVKTEKVGADLMSVWRARG